MTEILSVTSPALFQVPGIFRFINPLPKGFVMSPQAGWILQEEVVPRLRSAIPRTVNCVGCEDAEELLQDATAIAAKMFHSAEAAGKTFTPGNIAYYAIQHLKSGRRSTGSSTVDVMGSGTQLHGNTRLNSLDEPAATDEETGGEPFTFNDVLSQNQEDPSVIAARKLDWQTLLTRLSQREKAIIAYLLEGKTVSDVAVAFKVSRSAMQQCKDRLARLIREFLGVDILIEVARLPGWRNDLNTTRERLACRYERRN
jgi:DNA-directed RNA polymerase specialized sigma24 family protein